MPVTFQEFESLDNGANFYTSDLHIHTLKGSPDVTDTQMTVEGIVETAVKQHISIIAITDHNNDQNIAAALEEAAKFAGQLLLIPGVEITTAHGHLLVYFPQEKADNVGALLARIGIVPKKGAQDSHTTASMAGVIAEAEKLGGLCIAAHIDRPSVGFEVLAKGYPNWKRDVITSAGLYGLEFDRPENLIWYSADDEPTSDGGERKKLLTARASSPGTSARPVLATIQNSDAHSLADFVARNQKRLLTRFKLSELSFEGLRNALIDPEARTRAAATIPPAVPRVLGIQIGGGFLDGCMVRFSDNLNTFIGGRGTGKSTSVTSLAYGLGIRDELQEQDNCPDNVVIYCEDAGGVKYRYERLRGQDPVVRARSKDDNTIREVAPDTFRVEFYGQGELSEVAKDPLKHPTLLQHFLDKHIVLSDLQAREAELVGELAQNSSQLTPLEAAAAVLSPKLTKVKEINAKLQVAETGKLKEIASFQSHLAAEQDFARALDEVRKVYDTGLTLGNFRRDYDAIAADYGAITGDSQTAAIFPEVKKAISEVNDFLDAEENRINARFKQAGQALRVDLQRVAARHQHLGDDLKTKIIDLQKKGLSGSIAELNDLTKERTILSQQIATIRGQDAVLRGLHTKRRQLLAELASVRGEMSDRRKKQLKSINENLKRTIEDYSVFLYYDSPGVIDEFLQFILSAMQGTYFQEETAKSFCAKLSPSQLADFVRNGDLKSISATGVGVEWAQQILSRLRVLSSLHELEVIYVPEKPVFKIVAKTAPPKTSSIDQLSDGQKHTILLTIAMLAESNLPLIIDQPEDDLDNAFIFRSVVSTLRRIKERRQVIMVTHNANIAVLGDSELILPMRRSGDGGVVFELGSIDRNHTRKAVQDILEGGELAFRKRKEIYGH